MTKQDQSPFAALSFSEQQEQWRQFRAQKLDSQPVDGAQEQPAPPQRMPRTGAQKESPPPRHANLDRVRERMREAARRAGSYQTTSKA